MTELTTKNLKKSFKEKIRKFWRPFVILFLVNFIIINWSDFSWVFNYRFISRGLEGFFERDKTQAVENGLPTIEIVKDLEQFNDFNNADGSLMVANQASSIKIPKIGITAPIIFPEGNNEEDFQGALKKGVIHYPGSVLPGKNGVTIILGHSAPPNWPKINYDWVFNDLNKLNAGDKIHIDFNGRQYVFAAREKFFLQRGEEIPSHLTNSEYMLILISCWPPGNDIERILLAAELQRN